MAFHAELEEARLAGVDAGRLEQLVQQPARLACLRLGGLETNRVETLRDIEVLVVGRVRLLFVVSLVLLVHLVLLFILGGQVGLVVQLDKRKGLLHLAVQPRRYSRWNQAGRHAL